MVATRNVTFAAQMALFIMQNNSKCWLHESRGVSDTYVFADDNGAFPQLESFGVYEIEVVLAISMNIYEYL